MRTNLPSLALAALLLAALDPRLSNVFAQGTTITYQGRLSENSSPANGSYDFTFQVFDAASGGASQGGPLATNGVTVSDGLFTVALDFGAGSFSAGAPRWLEIQTRRTGGGAFGTLSPRQALTATPYAITAGSVVSGGINSGIYGNAVTFNNANNSFFGAFAGNGGSVTNVNAATVNGLTSASFWNTNGNAGVNPTNGAFFGTADNLPLEIKVNGTRALRLEPTLDTPNVIGGYSGNSVQPGIVGATIGGGGTSILFNGQTQPNIITNGAEYCTIAGGYNNLVAGYGAAILGGSVNRDLGAFSVLLGGQFNEASGDYSSLGGGRANTNQGFASVINGGTANLILSLADRSSIGGGGNNLIAGSLALPVYAAISGGQSNSIQTNATFSSIVGGLQNTIGPGAVGAFLGGGSGNSAGGSYATVPGGYGNVASGGYSFAAGTSAQATNSGTFVWADNSSFQNFASTASNQFLIRAAGGVGIGKNNPASALDVNGVVTATAFDGNGSGLTSLNASQIATGTVPTAQLSGTYSSALTFNNPNNILNGSFTGNGSALTNVNAVSLSGLAASNFWQFGGSNVTTGQFLGSTNNQPLELKANGVRAMRFEPTVVDANHSNIVNVVGGSPANYVSNGVYGATISGGGALNYFGAASNSVTGNFGTVAGGRGNTASGFAATAMGDHTTASGDGSTAMGSATTAGSAADTAMGNGTSATGGSSTAMGYHAVASGLFSVAMGSGTTAGGDNSLAAGNAAQALNPGCFVWADGNAAFFTSTAPNQFLIRASGGVGIGKNNPATALDVNGTITCVSLTQTSDRNAKEKFAAVSSRAVLDKVAALPISEWNFKNEPATRHLGPMAQDFYSAFNVGTDEKHIAPIDEGGVALAAIQGLNEKLETEAKAKDAEIQSLKQSVAELKQLVQSLAEKK